MVVGELASPALDDDPTLTADMLEIVFNSDRAGGMGQGDIWVATRTSTAEPFGAPRNVTELNTAADETTPEISGDGLTLYFSKDTLVANQQDIYVTTRATRTSPWGTPVLVTELDSPSDNESAVVTRSGTTVYFDSPRASEPLDTLFTATRADAASPWSTPTVITELDVAGEEENPFITVSELELWYTADDGTGYDLMFATRPAVGMTWSPAVRADDLNSPALDTDPWLSDDGKTIFMSSARSGDYEIYTATRLR